MEFQPKLDKGSKLSLLLKGLNDFQTNSFQIACLFHEHLFFGVIYPKHQLSLPLGASFLFVLSRQSNEPWLPKKYPYGFLEFVKSVV